MAYADVILADSPVGYWRLGESAGTNADDAASTNDGTYTSGFTLGAAGALVGDADTAVTLNGTTGRITIPSTFPTLASSAMSCEAWIKTANASTVGQIIFGAYNTVGSNQGWGFIYNQGSADNKLGFLDTTSVVWRKSTGTIADTNYHHVVVTVSAGGAYTFYIDAQPAGTVAAGTGHAPNSYTAGKMIGAATNASSFFNGTLDEVAVYSAELTSGQVTAHYNAGLGIVAPTLYVNRSNLRF